jgi:hypothetical protein
MDHASQRKIISLIWLIAKNSPRNAFVCGNANWSGNLQMVSKLSDWSGATKTTSKGCPENGRGDANQNGVVDFVLYNDCLSTNIKGEGERLFIAFASRLIVNSTNQCQAA